jgi:hypothetical protein
VIEDPVDFEPAIDIAVIDELLAGLGEQAAIAREGD